MLGRKHAEMFGSPHGQFGGFAQPMEKQNATQKSEETRAETESPKPESSDGEVAQPFDKPCDKTGIAKPVEGWANKDLTE